MLIKLLKQKFLDIIFIILDIIDKKMIREIFNYARFELFYINKLIFMI